MSLYLSHIYLNLVVWKCESVKIWKYVNEPLPCSSKSRKVGLLVIFFVDAPAANDFGSDFDRDSRAAYGGK